MSISFEVVELHDGSVDAAALQRNINKLASLLFDTGGKSLGFRIGRGTVTFPTATQSNTLAVSHGLGRAPVVVLATCAQGSGVTYATTAYTATTFSAQGQFYSALTGNNDFVWVAIG